jgi:hypothetical protein
VAGPSPPPAASLAQKAASPDLVERAAKTGEARFRATARSKLEPLLGEIVRTAGLQGHRAAYQVMADGAGISYRLEIVRANAPRGLPAPFVGITCGSADDVQLQFGGSAVDPLRSDARSGGREVSWSRVEEELRDFSRRALKRV